MKDLYLVLGNPIEHSLSPVIHKAFAEQTHQDLTYDHLLVPLNKFEETLNTLRKDGVKGVNITIPFKQEALAYVKKYGKLSPRAEQAGAVNTIKFDEDGNCFGDNTDGVGLIQDLTENLKWKITGKRILVIGAGGAARGILNPLLDKEPAEITIVNRTYSTAKDLAHLVDREVKVSTFEALKSSLPFDLIVNATASSLQNESLDLPASILTSNTHCYDLAYDKEKLTPFLNWAKTQGCSSIADGLGMLIEQAAEAFFVWRNVRPETKEIAKIVRPPANISSASSAAASSSSTTL